MYPHLVFSAGLVAAEVASERLFPKVDDGHVPLGFVFPTEHLKNKSRDNVRRDFFEAPVILG